MAMLVYITFDLFRDYFVPSVAKRFTGSSGLGIFR